jgi:hypothetical protein
MHTAILQAAQWLRGDPITLTRVAPLRDLSHFVGEVY